MSLDVSPDGKTIAFDFLGDIFPGARLLGYWQFRITRNSELYVEEETSNLLKAVETELHNRRKGDVVRLELEKDCPSDIRQALLGTFRLGEDDLFVIDGPLNPTRLMAILEGDHSPELRDAPFLAPVAAPFRGQADLFAVMRERVGKQLTGGHAKEFQQSVWHWFVTLEDGGVRYTWLTLVVAGIAASLSLHWVWQSGRIKTASEPITNLLAEGLAPANRQHPSVVS